MRPPRRSAASSSTTTIRRSKAVRRSQSGQALIAMFALLTGMLGGFVLLFNAGQVVNDKIRLTNATDAAAYSAAQWEARSLNYQAYLNRAIVANEVAIA